MSRFPLRNLFNQFLQDQLAKNIDFLDLTDWQKEKLHSVSINTIGELAASNESAVMKAYYVGEVRAKQMKNAAYAALFEYLLGEALHINDESLACCLQTIDMTRFPQIL